MWMLGGVRVHGVSAMWMLSGMRVQWVSVVWMLGGVKVQEGECHVDAGWSESAEAERTQLQHTNKGISSNNAPSRITSSELESLSSSNDSSARSTSFLALPSMKLPDSPLARSSSRISPARRGRLYVGPCKKGHANLGRMSKMQGAVSQSVSQSVNQSVSASVSESVDQ